MRNLSIVLRVLTTAFILIIITGCSSYMYNRERALIIDDVINMSKANAGSDVIINQIRATHSRFKLETNDIIRLKNEGVEDDVIEYMIRTDFTRRTFGWEFGYRPYDYWYYHYDYYYSPTVYPIYDYYYYYSPFWNGLREAPYYRYHSPYYYPVNISTDFYWHRSQFNEGDYNPRSLSPYRRPDQRRPLEFQKSH